MFLKDREIERSSIIWFTLQMDEIAEQEVAAIWDAIAYKQRTGRFSHAPATINFSNREDLKLGYHKKYAKIDKYEKNLFLTC